MVILMYYRKLASRWVALIAKAICITSVLAACTVPVNQDRKIAAINDSALPTEDVAIKNYIIQAGDELKIDFYSDLGLDQVMTVRPDGRISLQLIGEVKADGLKVFELQDILKKKYSSVLSDTRLNVIVTTFSSNVVFIGGAVKQPSAINFSGKITTLQAIALTGGFEPKTAILDDVLVIRRLKDKPPQRFSVDLTKVIDGTDLSQDLYLYQYDTIYVKSKE